MKKILLLWYMEEDNFGDVLLADTTKRRLKEAGCKVVDCEVGSSPDNIIFMANNCDFVLFGGGGIIERYIPGILQKFDQYFKRIKVPYGVIGISVGRFNYDYKSISLGAWIDNACFFYVRDEESRHILNQYSSKKKVKCSGDCVFLNENIWLKPEKLKNIIGINVRELPYPDLTGELDFDKIVKIKNLFNAKLIFDSSKSCIEKVSSKEEYKKYEIYMQSTKIAKIEQIISQIQDCDLIIGMRYHVVLAAALSGIPSVAIKYCPKVETLVKQLGIDSLAVDINEYDEIINKVMYLKTHYDEYTSIINNNVSKIRNKVEEMYKEIVNIIIIGGNCDERNYYV